MRGVLHGLRLLTPKRCVVCQCRADTALCLCEPCKQALPTAGAVCRVCGKVLPRVATGLGVCASCRETRGVLSHTMSLYRYSLVVKALISSLKFHDGLAEAHVLGSLLGERLFEWYGSDSHAALVPVPLHPTRLQARGYNQALLLAREAARVSGIPVLAHAIQRTRDTRPQSELDGPARRRNLQAAFALCRGTSLSVLDRLIIVDDVMTTLSTVKAVAGVLRAGGAQTIDAWSIAVADRSRAGWDDSVMAGRSGHQNWYLTDP